MASNGIRIARTHMYSALVGGFNELAVERAAADIDRIPVLTDDDAVQTTHVDDHIALIHVERICPTMPARLGKEPMAIFVTVSHLDPLEAAYSIN